MTFRLDQTYLLNLDKDTERLASFDAMMKKCNWNYKRLPAVYGKRLTSEQAVLKEEHISNNNNMGPSAIGCSLTHLSAWLDALKNNHQRVAIFEDDARLINPNPHVLEPIAEFYQYLKDNDLEEPDIFFLGKCFEKCGKLTPLFKNVFQGASPLCSHAYIITAKGIQKILAQKPFAIANDAIVKDLIEKGTMTSVVFHPSLFFQDAINHASTLRDNRTAVRNAACECGDSLSSTYAMLGIAIFIIVVLLVGIFWYFSQR